MRFALPIGLAAALVVKAAMAAPVDDTLSTRAADYIGASCDSDSTPCVGHDLACFIGEPLTGSDKPGYCTPLNPKKRFLPCCRVAWNAWEKNEMKKSYSCWTADNNRTPVCIFPKSV